MTGSGGTTYADPVEVKCLWEDAMQLVDDMKGREVQSSSTVYVDRALVPEGQIVKGRLRDFTDEQKADPLGAAWPVALRPKKVIKAGSYPWLHGPGTVNQVWL